MAAKDLPECVARNRQLNFHVLQHRQGDGVSQYTIGVWEGSVLRAICHTSSLSGALLALSGELESTEQPKDPTIAYPKWSDVRELVRRLSRRTDTDCLAAAGYLEDLHARLHNAVGDLESIQDRLTKFGALIEEAAAKSRCIGDSGWTTVAIPDDTWFRLLAAYRGKEEGNRVYREIHVLRQIAGITAQTIQAVDNWLGHAGTREAAMDSLWRLMRILEAAGYKKPLEHLEWRGQLVRAMEEAGIGLGDDGALRVRQPQDKYWEPATGPLIKEVLQAAQQAT
jgi:hypothetical protein